VTRTQRTCAAGHVFTKTSDCPTCPRCEAAREPAAEFMRGLAAPARRALEGAGLTTLAKIARCREAEVAQLHGIGANALASLRRMLKKAGLKYSRDV
jgi:predicted RecB family nuclease